MGREIVYCSRCGDRILASEFGEGLAGTVEGNDYCRKCMRSRSGQAEDALDRSETTPPPGRSTPQKPMGRPTGTARMPLATGPPRPKEARPPWKPARDTSKRTLLIIAAVVLVVLLVLVLVTLTKRGSGA